MIAAGDPGAAEALQNAGVTLPGRPESYALVTSGGVRTVIGRDCVGAMYGALDVADRVQAHGAEALTRTDATPEVQSPATEVRAANLFLVLPTAGEGPWWFREPGFWEAYLDLMARARMNLLDLHGMYNTRNGIFPNALLYFGQSASLPSAGVGATEREANVTALRRVVEMAAARGIRVSLMTYRSDLDVMGDSEPTRDQDRAQRTFAREASEDLARRVPGLSRVGFRIGESGHDAEWYTDTIIAGVRAAGGTVGVATRTWGASKPQILALSRAAGGDLLVECKYNGEHLGTPYVIAGGRMTWRGFGSWAQYSYEDFLQAPRPYQFVFQVRAGGTHRVFRNSSYERARRAAETFTFAGAAGFTWEPTHAYLPQRDVFHANPDDRFSPWAFSRDELEYLLYGRLAYDPTTGQEVFRDALAERVGTGELWDPMQAAGDIVPWIQTTHTCGPDLRNFSPELEWGGPVGYWATAPENARREDACEFPWHGPFDSFAVASAHDLAADLVAGRGTSRLSPLWVAARVLDDARRARAASEVAVDGANPWARDVVRECVALADLGEYWGHKMRGAAALAVYQASGSEAWLQAARDETFVADRAWEALARDSDHLAPFFDRLRMWYVGLGDFHWRRELAWLPRDAASIAEVERAVRAHPPVGVGALPTPTEWLAGARGVGPSGLRLTVDPLTPMAAERGVTATLSEEPPSGAAVNLLWKPFHSHEDWRSIPMTGRGTQWNARVMVPGAGAMFAVEVVGAAGVGRRLPDVVNGVPYVVVAP